jgi:hypothetical protein
MLKLISAVLFLYLTAALPCTGVDGSQCPMAADSYEASRIRMLNEVSQGAVGASMPGDASRKTILARGCDPVMAERSKAMLPPLLGGASIQTTTDDDDFITLLQERKYDVIFFAPGACRYSMSSLCARSTGNGYYLCSANIGQVVGGPSAHPRRQRSHQRMDSR